MSQMGLDGAIIAAKLSDKHIGSVFTDEQDLLKSIMKIHNIESFDLDPMYSRGDFYKEIPKPKYTSDILTGVDARHLPYENNEISTMILDPPFLFGIHGPNGIQGSYSGSKRFGIFKDYREISIFYQEILFEAYRILKRKGILIFKCQDYTDNKTWMMHCFVYAKAVELGFYAKDLAILYLSRNKVANSQTTQRHLRKHHTYFWVFVKN